MSKPQFSLWGLLVAILLCCFILAAQRLATPILIEKENQAYRSFLMKYGLDREKERYVLKTNVGEVLDIEPPFVRIRLDKIDGRVVVLRHWLAVGEKTVSVDDVGLTHQPKNDRRFGKVRLNIGGQLPAVLIVTNCSKTEIEYAHQLIYSDL